MRLARRGHVGNEPDLKAILPKANSVEDLICERPPLGADLGKNSNVSYGSLREVQAVAGFAI
jgi:hypothetical protein